MTKMVQNRKNITLLLGLIFQITLSQIPCVSKKYSLDNFINAFIATNSDENFKPNKSLIYISSFYYNDKGYMITLTRDNIKSIMVNPKSPNLEYFKYDDFDLLLQGKTKEDVKFLTKVIKNKKNSLSSEIFFKDPYNNVSYEPYQWYLLFDKKMNLINYTIPEDKTKIEEIFSKFNIKHQ